MEDKVIEFSITGCIYTGEKDVSLDEVNDKFIDWIESMGWQFCGIMKPIADIVDEIENEELLALVEERMKNDDGTRYTLEEVKERLNLKFDDKHIEKLSKEIEFQ